MDAINWLDITEQDERTIRLHAERGYPEEVCGFLFGRDTETEREIVVVEAVSNARDTNRENRFLIGPIQFLWAERAAKARGLDLLGFYHSHPDHPAIPSEFDRDHALPFYTYIIVSVRNGQSAELRSWQLQADRSDYIEETINITEVAAAS